MSRDKYSEPESCVDAVPRVKANNLRSFMGTHRAPLYFDELDARSVVDLLFPSPDRARIKFVKESDDMLRVVYLPAP